MYGCTQNVRMYNMMHGCFNVDNPRGVDARSKVVQKRRSSHSQPLSSGQELLRIVTHLFSVDHSVIVVRLTYLRQDSQLREEISFSERIVTRCKTNLTRLQVYVNPSPLLSTLHDTDPMHAVKFF